jgi:hypothetical protein
MRLLAYLLGLKILLRRLQCLHDIFDDDHHGGESKRQGKIENCVSDPEI